MKPTLIYTMIVVISLIVLGVGSIMIFQHHPSGAGAKNVATSKRTVSDDDDTQEIHSDSEHYTDYTEYPGQYFTKLDSAADHPGFDAAGTIQTLTFKEMTSKCRDSCTSSKDCQFFTVTERLSTGDPISGCFLYNNATNLKPFTGSKLERTNSNINSYKKR